jgi:hypothetical protein
MDVTPHIAQNDTNRRSAIDERTTRHLGYQVSQKKRKRIEEVFGWMWVSSPILVPCGNHADPLPAILDGGSANKK